MNAITNIEMTQVRDTAKVFTTGRSQAVRLPKAYRFNTAEVTIERQGDAVILRPKPNLSNADWAADLFSIMSQMKAMEPIERERGLLLDDIESLDA